MKPILSKRPTLLLIRKHKITSTLEMWDKTHTKKKKKLSEVESQSDVLIPQVQAFHLLLTHNAVNLDSQLNRIIQKTG